MIGIKEVFSVQKFLFNSNETKSISFRIAHLKKLKEVIQTNELALMKAIHEDFGKSSIETYITELSIIYKEIDYFIKYIKQLSKPKKVSTSLVNFPSRGYIIPEPLGVTLVIGAWNYPYQLSLVPAIAAIAAGNTAIVKPSELPKQTSAVLADLINSHFPKELIYVVEGGIDETTDLLALPFDKIFFTGSTAVGKIVYAAAAKNLTPVTLELGGKSPTFVLKDCDIVLTAKRLVWAKLLNAGQTCVAPDYVLVESSIKEALVTQLKFEMDKYPKSSSEQVDHYLKIINMNHFDRLAKFLGSPKVCYGGKVDRDQRFISPTLLDEVNWDDEIMQEEIFGPILPILSFDQLEEAIYHVKLHSKPLACYVYGKDKQKTNRILKEVSFGGGAVNDSLMHLTEHSLPFGGVGASGMGSYHGKSGFETFSHFKSVLSKSFWFESPLKYPPYSEGIMKLLKRFL
ncbi:aldehyde dehydrogenase [Myroides pelagicus]|uniref:Aldehyde dehydrogenase n=1 Tax=Myroides pelagicus TaxID=270914 RepID=A0A7K1GLK5_9FLAO|nr:aldehyde dehydrogenase [Myroides pelagicus]MEC4113179.1 aldehyde dehydrogenase [Myroides pelagicus]MTH29772.1 aldehyde dehydrogenase family protein [Myroides pelagicus]